MIEYGGDGSSEDRKSRIAEGKKYKDRRKKKYRSYEYTSSNSNLRSILQGIPDPV
jgi:hypothetical protein